MVCLSVGAQENAEQPSELERTLSGIEKIELMKRGLDTDASLQPGGTQDFVPTVSREAETLPSAPLMTDPDRESADVDVWKSENWLIDGIRSLDKDGSDKDEESKSNSLENEPSEGSAKYWLQLAMKQSEREAEAEESIQKSKMKSEDQLAATNPLNDFMSDWLSDEELMRLDISRPATETDRLSPNDVTWNPAFNTADSVNSAQLRDVRPKPSAISADSVSVNPYLQTMGGSTDPAGNILGGLTGQAGALRSAPVSVPTSSQTIRPISNSATAPETKQPWKPPAKEDEKYFRRLNRF